MSDPDEPSHQASSGLAVRSTAEQHRQLIDLLRGYASTWFAEHSARRSMLVALSQYWNDGADDEMHAFIVASTRVTPVWPHVCAVDFDPAEDEAAAMSAALPGEECENCRRAVESGIDADLDDYFRFYGSYGDACVVAFELFCREGSHQEMHPYQAYVPFAIARRRDGNAIDIELVGRPQRPANQVIGTAAQPLSSWDTPKLRALYEEICRAPDDDGPRHVMSDLLVETRPSDPRGELIALSLARDLRPADRARRDALIADHLAALIHPLGAVIPPSCARFDRGFLVEADVYAKDDEACGIVQDAVAWGTVEVLRIASGSEDVLDPAMRALRDVGPLGEFGVLQLCCAPAPWAIERLHVGTDATDERLGDLSRTPLLPRLRHLVITNSDARLRAALDSLATAPWWPQLERVTLVVDDLTTASSWRALRPPHVVLAISEAADDQQPAGWELAFGPDNAIEIAMIRWHANGGLSELAALINQLPRDTVIRLRSTQHRELGADELAYLRKKVPHHIVLG